MDKGRVRGCDGNIGQTCRQPGLQATKILPPGGYAMQQDDQAG